MKKAITFIIALTMISSMAFSTVLAADISDTPPALVIDASSRTAQPIIDRGNSDLPPSRANTVIDLGTTGSANINWSMTGGQTIRSTYNYKTGSGKIVLILTGTPAGSVIFYLYDSTDTLIGSYTAYVPSSGSVVVPYTNLFTNREYYVKAYNVSQYSLTAVGTIGPY